MTEYAYENSEVWHTALRLASNVGRLKIASNLKAVGEAQERAFAEAGRACALIAEASIRDGGGQIAAYRDARGALAQCQAWLHVIAELTNDPPSVFSQELDTAEQASKQLGAAIRAADMRRDGGRPGPGGPPRGGGRPQGPGMSAGGARGGGPRGPRGGN